MNYGLRDVPPKQTYFFNHHDARLSPRAYSMTASYEVKDTGYLILLSHIPVVLKDAKSPGNYKGPCFHYAGEFCVPYRYETPEPAVISHILHDLMNFELNLNGLKSVMIDTENKTFQSQVTINAAPDTSIAGVVISFLFSFRVTEDAILAYTLDLISMVQDATEKLAEIGEAKRAAADAAGQVIAAAANSETKH